MVLFMEVISMSQNLIKHFLCRDFKFQYLRQSSTRIGGKYKKAVYTLYKNESFIERLETKQRKNELGILGPVIRAQIRDVIKVRSYSIKINPLYSILNDLKTEQLEDKYNVVHFHYKAMPMKHGTVRKYCFVSVFQHTQTQFKVI